MKSGNIHTVSADDHNFEYRNSIFKNNNYIILETTFKLEKVDREMQLKEMDELITKRRFNQPLEWPSAGSTFKRGEDFIVSLFIDECGLKGRNVNDAEVSTKHAGFIINKGNAKAKDILDLVDIVKEEVKNIKGKTIELEIIVIGE